MRDFACKAEKKGAVVCLPVTTRGVNPGPVRTGQAGVRVQDSDTLRTASTFLACGGVFEQ